MHTWKFLTSNVGALSRSVLLANSIFVSHRKHFCDRTAFLARTAILAKGFKQQRAMDVTEGTVVSMRNLSPTVKGVRVSVPNNKCFTFKAGQWVDFHIPNMKEIAGYSIASSPKTLSDSHEIELAIKFSDFPPTKWVHETCQVGSRVGLVVGGDFFYAPEPSNACRDLLLVAGGVGINPLMSIIRHVADLKTIPCHAVPHRVVLAYSSRNFDELIFKDEICDVVSKNSEMKVKFFVTNPNGPSLDNLGAAEINTNQRIDDNVLSSILKNDFTDITNLDCYVCGPSSLIDDVDKILLKLNVSQSRIKYEKWW